MKITMGGGLFEFTVKPVIGIAAIVCMISLIFVLPSLFPGNCSKEKRYFKREIIGEVEKKFYDLKNHGSETILYSIKGEAKEVIFNNQSEHIHHYINVGDSLNKPSGTLDVKIIRKGVDTVFTIDFGCDKY